jgi:hypothetical protein
MCASILGAAALLCLGAPAVVLGRHGDDAETQVTSAADRTTASGNPAPQAGGSQATPATTNEHGRRPFTQPPGHRARPARDAAPGHLRPHGKPPVLEEPPSPPTGDVLAATPRPAAQKPSAVARGGASGTGKELAADGFVRVRGAVRMPSSLALANGSQRAGALGAVLGVTAAFSPAFGDLAMPSVPDRLGATLVLLVLCSQVLAAALLSSAVPQILGAFGSPRLR